MARMTNKKDLVKELGKTQFYEITNAKIASFDIFIENHGILTSFVDIDYGNSRQGYGGYSHIGERKYTLVDTVLGLLAITDSLKIDQIAGEPIRVFLKDDGFYRKIVAIGHYLEDKWFTFD